MIEKLDDEGIEKRLTLLSECCSAIEKSRETILCCPLPLPKELIAETLYATFMAEEHFTKIMQDLLVLKAAAKPEAEA